MRTYYLDIALIKRLMQERGLTEQTLAEQMGIPEKRLHFYLTSWKQKCVPFKIMVLFYNAFQIPFNTLITTTPPESQK